jgi:hypothetical protein
MQIKVRKYKMTYSAETTRPGEYTIDARNNKPRKMDNLRMDRICFGIRIDRAVANRIMARRAITASHPT